MKASLATDHRKAPEMLEYRRLTSREVMEGMRHFTFIGHDGKVRKCRASGQLKTWTTRPGDYRLPVKFGLYESSAIVPAADDPTLAAFEQSQVLPVVECCEAVQS